MFWYDFGINSGSTHTKKREVTNAEMAPNIS